MKFEERLFFFERWVDRTATRWYRAAEVSRVRAHFHMLEAIGIETPLRHAMRILREAFEELGAQIRVRLMPALERAGNAVVAFARVVEKAQGTGRS